MYKDLVRTSQRTPCPPIRKAKWPILYNETISLCCTKYAEHTEYVGIVLNVLMLNVRVHISGAFKF